jgi:hypothetical protein
MHNCFLFETSCQKAYLSNKVREIKQCTISFCFLALFIYSTSGEAYSDREIKQCEGFFIS